MDVDFEDDGMAAGRFLRVKVRLDVRKPLMRGIMADLWENVGGRWCPVSYVLLYLWSYWSHKQSLYEEARRH